MAEDSGNVAEDGCVIWFLRHFSLCGGCVLLQCKIKLRFHGQKFLCSSAESGSRVVWARACSQHFAGRARAPRQCDIAKCFYCQSRRTLAHTTLLYGPVVESQQFARPSTVFEQFLFGHVSRISPSTSRFCICVTYIYMRFVSLLVPPLFFFFVSFRHSCSCAYHQYVDFGE